MKTIGLEYELGTGNKIARAYRPDNRPSHDYTLTKSSLYRLVSVSNTDEVHVYHFIDECGRVSMEIHRNG